MDWEFSEVMLQGYLAVRAKRTSNRHQQLGSTRRHQTLALAVL
jgi:hypothetical protein